MEITQINPVKASLALVQKSTGIENPRPYSTEPLINIYKIQRFNSSEFGPTLQMFTTGCPYRCAMCWVHDEALGMVTNGQFLREKILKLPNPLKALSIAAQYKEDKVKLYDTLLERACEATAKKIIRNLDSDPENIFYYGQYFARDLYSYMHNRIANYEQNKGKKLVAVFSGGCPPLYQRSLLDFSFLARDDDLKVGIVTEGFHIGEYPEYLDGFSENELQGTVHWADTIKNVTPESFNQLTGVEPHYQGHDLTTTRRLLKTGFSVAPMVLLNTFATKEELEVERDKNPVHIMHRELSAIGKNYPSLLMLDKVYSGARVDDSTKQRWKMKHRGYEHTSPGAVKEAITIHFESQGTPIMKFTPQEPVIKKGRKIIEEAIFNLSAKAAYRDCFF